MSESKGSRNVSLGPYRSTEIALEDRLSKEQSTELSVLLETKRFGKVYNNDFNLEKFVPILLAIGYEKKDQNFYVRSGNFVYAAEGIDSYQVPRLMLVSGNYDCGVERILSDIEIINYMQNFHLESRKKEDSGRYVLSTLSVVLGSGALSGVTFGIILGVGIGTLSAMATFFASFLSKDILEKRRYNSKMSEIASSLLIETNNYKFGRQVYDKIIEEYYNLTAPKLLESSKIAQLPEPKAIVGESPADNEQTSNVPKELEEYIERNIEYFGSAVKRLKFTKW